MYSLQYEPRAYTVDPPQPQPVSSGALRVHAPLPQSQSVSTSALRVHAPLPQPQPLSTAESEGAYEYDEQLHSLDHRSFSPPTPEQEFHTPLTEHVFFSAASLRLNIEIVKQVLLCIITLCVQCNNSLTISSEICAEFTLPCSVRSADH